MPQLAPLIYLSLGGQFEADGKGSICPIIPIESLNDDEKNTLYSMLDAFVGKRKLKEMRACQEFCVNGRC
jgi:hypothetical protein